MIRITRFFLFQIPSWTYSPISPPLMINPDIVENVVNYLDEEERANNVDNKQLLSFYKTVSAGSKVIRIEVYNANQFESIEQSVCQCSAEICFQHIVKNIYTDSIYLRVKDMLHYLNNTFYQSL